VRVAISVLTVMMLSSCANPGAGVFELYPELEPGRTTWAAVQAAHGAQGAQGKTPQATDLGALVNRVLRHNARVQAAWEAWRTRIEAVGPSGALPNPVLSYTFLPLPVETRVGPNEHRIMVSQRIPSPPKLMAQHSSAVARAEAGRHAYDRAALTAVTQLKSAVAEIRYLQRARELLAVNVKLAEQLATAASQRLESEAATLFDVSKARSQLAQLQYDAVRFGELLDAAESRLNALLNRHVDTPIGTLPSWPSAVEMPKLTVLYERALRSEPGLRGLDSAIRAKIAGVSAARGQRWPELIVGAQLMVNGPAAMSGLDGSGDDALGVTLGVSLPLWFGADSARVQGAEAALRRQVHHKRDHVNTLLADIKEAFYRLRNGRRLTTLYDTTLLPEARKAMGDAEAWNRTQVGSFTDFLEARTTWYRFSLARERALADAVQAEARLELLIGGALDERAEKVAP